MISVATRWEGTPEAMRAVEAGSRAAKAQHESWGAKNPRLMRPLTGTGGMEVALYVTDFDSMEDYGRFWDQVSASDWFTQLQADVAAAFPDLRMADTVVMYDAIAD
ncbi:MAG: hypothetical protein ACJZ4L_06055 [Candidatus Poriferisodalaceae bacterium]